jgi:hypothetical protein
MSRRRGKPKKIEDIEIEFKKNLEDKDEADEIWKFLLDNWNNSLVPSIGVVQTGYHVAGKDDKVVEKLTEFVGKPESAKKLAALIVVSRNHSLINRGVANKKVEKSNSENPQESDREIGTARTQQRRRRFRDKLASMRKVLGNLMSKKNNNKGGKRRRTRKRKRKRTKKKRRRKSTKKKRRKSNKKRRRK